MGYSTVYKEIMRRYESDRRDAQTLLQNRRDEVYVAMPEIAEIEANMTKHAFSIAKLVLSGSDETSAQFIEIQKEMKRLKAEKTKLLKALNLKQDYFTNIYKCKHCSDTGYIQTKKCKCLQQRLVEKYYDVSNVKSIVKLENFDTFDFRFYGNEINENSGISPLDNIQMIYNVSASFAKNFNKQTTQSLLFYGKTGLGKTFLCNCIAKELLDVGKTVLYVTAPQIFKKIEDARFNKSEDDFSDEQIDMIYTVDLLIIDDLGSEFSTIVTNTALFDIINSRILSNKRTVISTNLSQADLQSNYTDRIVSRFLGNFKMLKFFGDDIRIKKKLNSYTKVKG